MVRMDLNTRDKITIISLTEMSLDMKKKTTEMINKINVDTKNVNIFILQLFPLAYYSIHSAKHVQWRSH